MEQLPETRATMAELGKQLEQVEAALEGDAMAASSDAEDKRHLVWPELTWNVKYCRLA